MNEDLSKLDLIGLLDRLVPVPDPVPISWWPATAAWLWVGAILLLLLLWALRVGMRRHRANAYRRAALRERYDRLTPLEPNRPTLITVADEDTPAVGVNIGQPYGEVRVTYA